MEETRIHFSAKLLDWRAMSRAMTRTRDSFQIYDLDEADIAFCQYLAKDNHYSVEFDKVGDFSRATFMPLPP